jgi:hypothetical protein
LVRGKVSAKDREGNVGQEVKIMVDDAREITTEQAISYQKTGKKKKTPKASKQKTGAKASTTSNDELNRGDPKLYIRLATSQNEIMLRDLKRTLEGNRGQTEVVLVLGDAESRQAVRLPDRIDSNDSVIAGLRELVGADNVKLH